ncbi:MAG: hypothetical protein AABX14_05685 [Candidatus Aenigmatarchaeota archaeon]
MNTLLSVAILLVIVFVAILLVLTIGRPTFDSAIKTADVKGAEDDLHFIDQYIRTVAREGRYAFRNYKFTSSKHFESIPGEDAIQFSTDTPVSLIDFMTRSFSGNYVYIAGADVNCLQKDGDGDGTTDLVAENDRLKAVFKKISSGTIDTSQIIMQVTDKTNNVTTYVGNSSILIDENPATSVGTGYTEIGNTGLRLPLCQVHAFVNSTIDYDVYYKLYAGADFLVIEVRNIA